MLHMYACLFQVYVKLELKTPKATWHYSQTRCIYNLAINTVFMCDAGAHCTSRTPWSWQLFLAFLTIVIGLVHGKHGAVQKYLEIYKWEGGKQKNASLSDGQKRC